MAGTTLGTAYVQIKPTTKGIGSAIKAELKSPSSEAGTDSGNTIASTLASSLKKMLATIGVAKIMKDSLDAGGAIQQSFGGIETLYGSAADTVKQFAAEAAKAGISANKYAEQAVSFGAALKQSFGDDLNGAAKAANTMLLDMADNSAKMGTDIESIQNAYQGFAKDNYTMLDNLKLGYGGTKSEMERLIADANALKVANGEAADLSIESFADVGEAIHLIQTELGLSGTAAYEAEQTFTGSANAMKASWENVIAAMTSGQMNLIPQLNQLAVSVSNFLFNNLMPMLGNFAVQLPVAIATFFKSALPIFTEQLANVGNQIVTFTSDLASNAIEFFELGGDYIKQLATGIINKIPDAILAATDVIANIIDTITSLLPVVFNKGIEVLSAIVSGIIKQVPELISTIPVIFDKFVTAWERVDWIGAGKKVIDFVCNGIQQLAANIPAILGSIGNAAVTMFRRIDWAGLGRAVMDLISYGIRQLAYAIPQLVLSIGRTAVNAFTSINYAEIGINLVRGIWYGISSMTSWIINLIGGFANSVIRSIKRFFGIHSPSTETAWMGEMLMKGFANGIEYNSDLVKIAMDDVNGMVYDTMQTELAVNATGYTNGEMQMNQTSIGDVQITVQAKDGQSAEEIADEVMYRMQHIADRNKAVFE